MPAWKSFQPDIGGPTLCGNPFIFCGNFGLEEDSAGEPPLGVVGRGRIQKGMDE
jgi:hypothetical protein